MVKIKTSKFGIVEVHKEDLLLFPFGLIGFEDLRNFFFLNDPFDEIFIWLQSFEKPDIAFLVLEPTLFNPTHEVELSKSDLEVLNLKKDEAYQCFSIVTIPESLDQMTANLKAPIVLNIKFKRGKQCVLQDPNLSISTPIFSKLRHQLAQTSFFSFKGQNQKSLSQKSPVLSVGEISSFYEKKKTCKLNPEKGSLESNQKEESKSQLKSESKEELKDPLQNQFRNETKDRSKNFSSPPNSLKEEKEEVRKTTEVEIQ